VVVVGFFVVVVVVGFGVVVVVVGFGVVVVGAALGLGVVVLGGTPIDASRPSPSTRTLRTLSVGCLAFGDFTRARY